MQVDPSRARPPQRRSGANAGPGERAAETDPVAERSSETWILEGVESEATGAVRRGRRGSSPTRRNNKAPAHAERSEPDRGERSPAGAPGPRGSSGANAGGADRFGVDTSPQRAKKLEKRLGEASAAFRRERYGDALKILQPMAREAPGSVEVRELLGLTFYRLGRWKDARRELTRFASMSGSTEQHPVLADCARALGRYDEVEKYWDELRRASPGADLVVEGRIVMAGTLADQGRLDDAIKLVKAGRKQVKRPQPRHLRIAYVLADLQERAGDLPTARSGFEWLQHQDPEFADVAERLATLR